ncbi:hypothetical protein [Flavobacterium litorale]|uniref:DUF4252 domain-containing protein n=1 Tax=Flavobacterium litorale TaxID=2856519 RepID=A0ABX8V8B3_9FLAO|nr:hypothetical protein [Flavobacterium litorale]QYJ68363.1 hypothetical protein K1I41_00280 [Flavobacterium litorale]
MKKTLTTLLLFVVAVTFAQDKKSLQERSAKMYEYTIQNEYAKLLDLTYPKIFDLVPKATMLQMLQGMMDNEMMRIELLDRVPNFSYSSIEKIENGYYSLVDHDITMKMIFKEPIGQEQGEMMVTAMKQQLESGEVSFDAQQNAIIAKKRSQMIAVCNSDTDNKWTFLNNDKGNGYVTTIFSDEVRNKLGI